MSREGAKREASAEPTGGTPIWVWLVYGLGIMAAVIFIGSVLFTLGAFISDDAAGSFNISTFGVVLWGGLMLAALVLLIMRRRKGRS